MYSFNLHLKVLSDPWSGIDQMLGDMRQVFAPAEIDFDLRSTENLTFEHLTDLEVGACEDSFVTAEQQALYSLRDGVFDDELVVYIVRSTDPFMEGCAAFNDERRPSAAIISRCSRWALAHEVGHLLGLDHVFSPGSLMNGTPPSPAFVPTLSAHEANVMQQSRYVRFVA